METGGGGVRGEFENSYLSLFLSQSQKMGTQLFFVLLLGFVAVRLLSMCFNFYFGATFYLIVYTGIFSRKFKIQNISCPNFFALSKKFIYEPKSHFVINWGESGVGLRIFIFSTLNVTENAPLCFCKHP